MSNTEQDEKLRDAKWGAEILDEQTFWTIADNIRAVTAALETAEQTIAEVKRLAELDLRCPCCTGYQAILEAVAQRSVRP